MDEIFARFPAIGIKRPRAPFFFDLNAFKIIGGALYYLVPKYAVKALKDGLMLNDARLLRV